MPELVSRTQTGDIASGRVQREPVGTVEVRRLLSCCSHDEEPKSGTVRDVPKSLMCRRGIPQRSENNGAWGSNGAEWSFEGQSTSTA